MTSCPKCQTSQVTTAEVEHSVKVAGRTYRISVQSDRCSSCGAGFIPVNALIEAEMRIAAELARTGPNTGETFRFMRKALGMSMTELAELLDVTRPALSRWENGHVPVDRGMWTTLAAIVTERVEGRSATIDRLHALANPPKVSKTVDLGAVGDRE
jgi:putative zinc finger/helix-turn-helix YgiT family protein